MIRRPISSWTLVSIVVPAVAAFLLFFGHFNDTVKIVLIFGAILTVVTIGVMREKPAPKPMEQPELPPSNNYGSSSWCGQWTLMDERVEAGVWRGVFFGKSGAPTGAKGDGIPICSDPESHVLITAKTGSGKGTRVLLPTLLRYGLGGPDGKAGASMIVIDPKGENASVSARARSLTSHVHIMNPWRELGSTYENLGFPPATFNPLDLLDKDDPNVVSIAQSIGKAMSPTEGQKEPFWASSAANLIAAVLLWLTQQPGEEKTLRRLSDILSNDRKSFTKDYLTRLAVTQGPPTYDGAVKRWSKPFLDMPDVTYGGVMGHIADGVAFLADPQIRAATVRSSFSMNDLTGAGKDRPTTLYLVVPADKIEIQRTWLRLMITAGMNVYKRKPEGARYRCMFMIDEFPALGRLDEMPTSIATLRSAGVDFTLVVQSFAKLRAIYGDQTDDIIANCTYKWFCNINDLSTAKYMSETLGRKTVKVANKGESEGENYDVKGWNDKPTGKSTGKSTSHTEMGVDLLPAAEALTLGPGVAILLGGSCPHYLWPVDYWRLQESFAPFRPQYPSLYWPLYYDRNAALAPDKVQCQPQPPPPAQPGAPPIWPVDPTYDPSLYQPPPPPQPRPEESAFAIFRKLFGRSKKNQTADMPQPKPLMSDYPPAAPAKPIDFRRFANWKPTDSISGPSTLSQEMAPPLSGTAPGAPEPKPVDPPKKIDFRRYANWKPPAPVSDAPIASVPDTPVEPPKKPKPAHGEWNLEDGEYKPVTKKPKDAGDT